MAKIIVCIMLGLCFCGIAEGLEGATNSGVVYAKPLYSIDYNVIAEIESSGNPLAYNTRTGAVGLYQITPICLKDYNQCLLEDHRKSYAQYAGYTIQPIIPMPRTYTINEMFDPVKAKIVATWYLEERLPQLLKNMNIPIDLKHILYAYNWGPGNVRSWYKLGSNQKILPKETKNYLEKYHKLLNRRKS